MKIPLTQEPFAPMTLSHAQEQTLQWLSEALLKKTLAENHEYVHQQNREMDKHTWKHVMACENLTIYKRTAAGDYGGSSPDVDLFKPQSRPRSRQWRLPLCVGVGTLAGSLDDLLYGALAPTALEQKVRTSYTKDDVADTRVLATIVRPTEEEPMRSMSVRWTLLSQTVHKVIVSPRDVVYMESMGTRILPSGERIGYIIRQSVDLPGCGELAHLGLIRANYSTCYIFRDRDRGSTEVYMRAFMDPGGKFRDIFAVFSACTALVSISRMVLAGQSKRLAYVVRTSRVNKSWPAPIAAVKRRAGSTHTKCCPLCTKSLSSFRRLAQCDLCQTPACTRCVSKRKLTHVVLPDYTLVRVPTMICKACITMAAKLNARDIARSEQVPGATRAVGMHSNATSVTSSRRHSPVWTPSHARGYSYRSQASDTTSCDSNAHHGFSCVSHASSDDSPTPSPSPACSSRARPASHSVDTVSSEDDANADTPLDHERLDLWIRMNRLRVTAEQTYQLTKHHGTALVGAVVTPALASRNLDTHTRRYHGK